MPLMLVYRVCDCNAQEERACECDHEGYRYHCAAMSLVRAALTAHSVRVVSVSTRPRSFRQSSQMHSRSAAQGWEECERVRGCAREVQHRRLELLQHTAHGISDNPKGYDSSSIKSLTADVDPEGVCRLTGWSPKTSS
jgi:hypothetical protein